MRLVTRSDFDGLGCAAVLKELGKIKDIKFVHPKDIQDGIIEINNNDILANIPYVKGCGMWFDHHSSEEERNAYQQFEGKCDPVAPSASRVIYDFYGGFAQLSNSHLDALIQAVDKADSGNFTQEEILNPTGWVLLSFVMDPRTGLGRYKDYRISNYSLMEDMIGYCRTKSAAEILTIPDVIERTERYFEQDKKFREMIIENSEVYKNVVVMDLRDQVEIYTGNRFMINSLFPNQNISVQVMWGFRKQNIVITCGYNIIKRDSDVDIGSLMLKHGGGGHRRVGTCQVPTENADSIIKTIINELNGR